MLTPKLAGALRRTSAWSWGRKLQRLVSPPVCAGVHAIVDRLGARYFPDDLVLKHVYDYRVVRVDPKLVTATLPVGEWYRPDPRGSTSRVARWQRWFLLGGGWKNAKRHVTRNLHGRFIVDGDWDQRTRRDFEIRPTIVQLFQEGRRPEDTTEYQRMRKWVQSGNLGWTRGCTTISDVDRYFAHLLRIYDDIRANGYRSQVDLGNDGADEIRVCIDRQGELCVFGGGTHRLSIALLLGLERVPVIVKRVHAGWVSDCLQRYGGPVHTAIAEGIRKLEVASEVSNGVVVTSAEKVKRSRPHPASDRQTSC